IGVFRAAGLCRADHGLADRGRLHPQQPNHGTADRLGRSPVGHARARRTDEIFLALGGAALRPKSRSGMMGWTLGRYFFLRYAVITSWFFLGIYALVFLIDFTEFSS